MEWQQVYQQWKNEKELAPKMAEDLERLEKDEAALKEAFYQPLEFGTAGMRGILGAGINRMNLYTVRQATAGLAHFISTKGAEAKKRGVVIAYDSRHQSPEFAMEAARTLAYHQIQAYVFESLRPTPELSFAVRHLHCIAGIMITASHNPKIYNGYKVYGEDGGQMPPQDADALTTFVRQIENPLKVETIAEDEVNTSDYIQIVGQEIDECYLADLKTVTVDTELIKRTGDEVKLVYTPLHGTGKMLGEKALKQIGFHKFSIVPEQAVADPEFSTLVSPNPEEASAFEYAIRLGEQENADLLVATDPDADRLGAAVRLPDGSYQVLTGNQLAAIMLEYLLSAHQIKGTLPTNAVVLKSIVSSELASEIARAYQVKMVDVLTGFKFIAEKIEQYEKDQSRTFMFGFEESYGYLVKSFVRDKDAIQALVLLAEVAAFYKEKGQNLYDALQTIFEKYGYYQEKTISVTMSGVEGSQKIQALMAQFREQSPASFGDIAVTTVEDFKTQQQITDGKVAPLDLPKADVLKFILADQSWIAIRPSGTEPKIKFYIGAKADSKAAVAQKVADFEAAIQAAIEKS